MVCATTCGSLQRIAWQLRMNLLELVGVGKAGHLGGSSSLAEIMSVLYFHAMRVDAQDRYAADRDRLVVSKGHTVLIQYAALAELGFFPKAELKNVKSLGALLQGHPDMGTPGIEAVTGSLGQGLSIGLGMALALRLDSRPSRVHVVMGDGELAEGQLWEAAMAAAAFRLDNLVGIVDRNRVQASGFTKDIFDIPNIADKWRAFGWNVLEIDGHDIPAIVRALEDAATHRDRPTVIVAETVKGKGFSFAENNAAFHNVALTEGFYQQGRRELEAHMAACCSGIEESSQ